MKFVAKAATWLFVFPLSVVIWTAHKLLSRARYRAFLLAMSHMFSSLGKGLMLQVLQSLATDPESMPRRQSTEDLELAEGPQLNPPNDEDEELPIIKDSTGTAIPTCFDPLPEYRVFEALFNAKYGRGGKCPLAIMGKVSLLPCDDLYALLDKISKDTDAPPMMKAVYGSVMSMVVMQHGKQMTAKTLN